MKKLILLILCIFSQTVFSQSLSLFNIDVSNFPKLRGNFYAFSKDGKQIIDLSITDFNLTENDIVRKITFISCPTPKPARPISAVLTLDVSGSMSGKGLEMAKTAAVAWVDAMPESKAEAAITSFTERNSLHQDFTSDKQKLKDAILSLRANGGTSFNAGFIDEPAGALLVAKNGKYKKVIVFLTDGFATGNQDEIIRMANEIGAIVYCVTLGSVCPDVLRNIAMKTGGMYFENVTSEEQAKAVYMQIMAIAQSLEPCTIEWESTDDCNAFRNVKLLLKTTNQISENSYVAPSERIPKIDYEPSVSLKFGNVEPPLSETKELTIVAKNKNIWIYGVNISHNDFQIIDWGGSAPPFILMQNSSRKIKVKYSPSKTGYVFCKFDVENSACFGGTFFATGGNFNPQTEIGSLKLTFPNGGETFIAGEDSIITWEGVLPEDTVSLDYSTDNGVSWSNITNKASDLKFNWKNIPNTPSDECLMKVTKGEEIEQKAGKLIKVLGFCTTPKVARSPISNEFAFIHSSLISIIDINTKSIVRTIAFDNLSGIYCIDYNPQGDRFVIGGGNGLLKMIDVKTGEIVKSFDIGKKTISLIKFSPSGNFFACSSSDSIYIFEVNSGALIGSMSGGKYGAWNILFSPNGEFLIASFSNYSIKIWDANSFLFRNMLSVPYSTKALAITPDSKKLAAGCGTEIKIWNMNNLEEIKSIYNSNVSVSDIDFSPNGEMIAGYLNNKSLKVWDVKSGFEMNNFSGLSNADGNVLFTHNGKNLISTGGRELKIWDLIKGKIADSLKSHTNTINKVSLSPDNTMIASTGDDGSIRLWDFKSGWNLKIIDGKSKWMQSVAFSNDNKYLISSSSGDTVIRVFDIATGNEVRKFSGHTAAVSSIKLSAAGDKLVSGGYDN
ncbi:VWA domain-containing protein, partial [Bacteroidetes/Chlorobi group bacterium ChocPot_Mid]